ncbi:CRAL/TRIO domain-containing protein [Cryphonectria parasitica EP155]|uniref:Phosphatidylinositol transfer protein SFH5 n=1 Tax=Cryphonectria parasitica (strain ATCC 38755 / EP155) TaxID=660469 RepID=A0A9P4Y058_CRYP1|nr:CRAL/TRIO domain-containing protein [Cryphonectria parasitica EP155]KAF3764099.1 CRAL/TRIO domain-containing protein [Cryphonectria parasitica EP155]
MADVKSSEDHPTTTDAPAVEGQQAGEGSLPSEPTADQATSAPQPLTDTASTTATKPEASPSEPAEKSSPIDSTTAPQSEKPLAGEADKAAEPSSQDAAGEEKATHKTPLDQFDAKLPAILKDIGHDEMWGVKLVSPASSHIPTGIVLQKFLNANDGDLTKAIEQFQGALKFRKEKKPLELLTKTFSANKFADLGAVTVYPVKDSSIPEVFTWNLYGNVKGKMDEVFVPLEEFMDYRIALQELGIQQLHLSSATEPITAVDDPYKIIQVHDYKSISFLRQNPNVKAASTEVIKQFALAYPELLKEKFFVNVPAIMGWMYAVIKVFIAEKTAKKFHPMANGANLAAEFKAGGLDEKSLPKEYGGEGGSGDGKMKDIPGLVDELKFA